MTMRKGDCGCNGVYGFFRKKKKRGHLVDLGNLGGQVLGVDFGPGLPSLEVLLGIGLGCGLSKVGYPIRSFFDGQRGFWVEGSVGQSFAYMCDFVGSGCHSQGIRQVPCR